MAFEVTDKDVENAISAAFTVTAANIARAQFGSDLSVAKAEEVKALDQAAVRVAVLKNGKVLVFTSDLSDPVEQEKALDEGIRAQVLGLLLIARQSTLNPVS